VKCFKNRVLSENYNSFQLSQLLEENEISLSKQTTNSMKEHLQNLESYSEQYFQMADNDNVAPPQKKLWISDTFYDNATKHAGIPDDHKEKLYELSSDNLEK
jgi:hypothetical protein